MTSRNILIQFFIAAVFITLLYMAAHDSKSTADHKDGYAQVRGLYTETHTATIAIKAPTNTPTAQPIPTELPIYHGDSVTVTRIVDGDTIVLDTGQTVRYIGIDTPELKSNDCYSKEATEANRQLVLGKSVQLEKDISETDRYGRLLRYVWVDNLMVNEWLVRSGFAKAYTYPPDVARANLFVEAQRKAHEEGLGLWTDCATRTTSQPTQSGCVIKGNISVGTGEKIYHVPGNEHYEDTVINESKGEQWFCSEEEAQNAGWRAAQK